VCGVFCGFIYELLFRRKYRGSIPKISQHVDVVCGSAFSRVRLIRWGIHTREKEDGGTPMGMYIDKGGYWSIVCGIFGDDVFWISGG
jgi:hypothetical protein